MTIINLILILLCIHYIGYFIFGSKNNTMNCGIFGWAGKNTSKFNKHKFDILGIINETRGVDSCGVSVDGEIRVGVGKHKQYRDFIAEVGYNRPAKIPTIIGHTRKSTMGGNTEYNAHPFGFGKKDDGFEFVAVHNGSLINHNDLADKYGVDKYADYRNINNVKSTRTKIDSELLLECLYKSKSFKVLSEYNGAAALLFVNINEPNVLYCYHGKSGASKARIDTIEEERPLYYYRENKHSLYVSSIEDSLKAIGGTDKTVHEFEHNIVYKITDGDIDNAIKYKVSRKDRYQKDYGFTGGSCNVGNSGTKKDQKYYDDMYDDLYDEAYYGYGSVYSNPNIEGKVEIESKPTLDLYNIYHEKLIKEQGKYGGRVYFNKLRYYRNGHLINGIYTWINDYGFYYLGDQIKSAEATFWTLVNKYFSESDWLINSKEIPKDAYIPFPSNSKNEIKDPVMFYFIDGVRMRSAIDYIACTDLKEQNVGFFSFEAFSEAAAHPICDITYKERSTSTQKILLGGKIVTDTICPLGSERVYHIKDGNCIRYEEINKNDKSEDLLDKAASNIEEMERGIILKIEEGKDETRENDLLEKEIEEIFTNNFRTFPLAIKRLKKYENHKRGKQAIKILQDFIKETSSLIAIEANE